MKMTSEAPYFRLVYVSKSWVGKPDPSGFGQSSLTSPDYSWLHEYAMKLKSGGGRVLRMEKVENGKCQIL